MLRRTSQRHIATFDVQPSLSWGFNPVFTKAVPKALEPVLSTAPTVTTTSNGVRIITQDLSEPVSAIGIYNKQAGAKYDPLVKPGLNYVLRCSLMLSNMEDSMFQFDKKIRSVGGSFEHDEKYKKYLGWKTEVQRDSYKSILTSMCNGCTIPRFHGVEVDRYRDQMDNIYEEYRWKTPRKYVVERLEGIAFYKEPLGQSRFVLPSSNDLCSPEALLNHYCTVFRPENVIIAGVNVDHLDLFNEYESADYKLSSSSPHIADAAKSAERARIDGIAAGEANEKDQYQEMSESTELEKRHEAMSTNPNFIEETIFAMGWCTNGRANSKSYAATIVAQEYINIALGASVRLRDTREQDVESFYSPFETAGLLGMTARVYPNEAHIAQRRMIQTMTYAAKAECHEMAVHRAVTRFFHDHLELRRDYIDFLATQEQPMSAAEFIEILRGVQAADVRSVFEECLARQPSQFATGFQSSLVPLRKL